MSAWTVIGHTELGGNATEIDFTSISGSYTDLVILFSCRTDRGNSPEDGLKLTFNNSTAAVYSWRQLYGYNNSASSNSGSSATYITAWSMSTTQATSSTFGNGMIYIPNYTSSNAKSVSIDQVSENNATTALQAITAGLWNPSTQAAITSVKLQPENGTNFVQYSSATLYGITKGSSGGVTVS